MEDAAKLISDFAFAKKYFLRLCFSCKVANSINTVTRSWDGWKLSIGKDRLLLLTEYFCQGDDIFKMYVCEIILIGAFSTQTLSQDVIYH